jgi:hypothetical protein
MDYTDDVRKEQGFAAKRHDGTGRVRSGDTADDLYGQSLVYRWGMGSSLVLSYLAMFAVGIAPVGYDKLDAIHDEKLAQLLHRLA